MCLLNLSYFVLNPIFSEWEVAQTLSELLMLVKDFSVMLPGCQCNNDSSRPCSPVTNSKNKPWCGLWVWDGDVAALELCRMYHSDGGSWW